MVDMEQIIELYDDFIGVKKDFFTNMNELLVGKECIINYWKNGKNHKRKSTILEVICADNWGIHLHIGIHRLDGQPGYLDDHAASWTRLSRVTFE